MNLPRSIFYADLGCEQEDAVVGEITAITETRRGYGYRRVTAELRNRGMVVNSRKDCRIMRENGLNSVRQWFASSNRGCDDRRRTSPANVASNL